MRFVYGGGKEGALLCSHPVVIVPEGLQSHLKPLPCSAS